MFSPYQILLSISLITSGSALRCYHCMPNKNSNDGSPSCHPEPANCAFTNETYCLSMRRRTSRNSEKTFKTCADELKCIAAHYACLRLKNGSQLDVECEALCCEGNLCNYDHDNAGNYATSSNSFLVFLTILASSLLCLCSVGWIP